MTNINIELLTEISQDFASIMRKNSSVVYSVMKLVSAMTPKQVEKLEKELEDVRGQLNLMTEEQAELSKKLALLIDKKGNQEIH